MINDLITVELTEKDAEMFILFQKYYKAFKLMDEKKLFDYKKGEVTFTFHYDEKGGVGQVEVEKSREFYNLSK